MDTRFPLRILMLVALGFPLQPLRIVQAQITAEEARQSIARGVEFLKRSQDRQRGCWDEQRFSIYPGGVTALCTLALLNSGVPVDDPTIVRALRYLREPKSPKKTYSVALQTMALCAAEPEKDRLQIRENVAWLQRTQVKPPHEHAGSWGYGEAGDGRPDPSNTQFAMLALYEAERAGVQVPEIVWRKSLGYWTRLQKQNGAWAYPDNHLASGSMTCAGIASTIIALGQTGEGDAVIRDGRVECCQPQDDHSIPARGLEWLARHFTVKSNPIPGNSIQERSSSQSYLFYYLYGVERVGRMTGNRFIGQHDWYREGAEMLVKKQDPIAGYWKGIVPEDSQPVGTSLALLFLAKGRRPLLVGKLKHADTVDWNRHRNDLAHLTYDVERRWKRDLSWQVIDGKAASLEDLLQTPVLFISGRDSLQLDNTMKQKLKQYVEQGGFIFAESCCEGEAFDRDFRQLMEELFPESPLRLLPPDHPVWYAEERVPSKYLRELWGVDACCRTSVVYCPNLLSCYWELASTRQLPQLPPEIEAEVRATLAIGANVLTYATNRELKEKLDAPQIIPDIATSNQTQRSTLYVAKVQHAGGADDAPAALSNLLSVARDQLQLRINAEKRLLSLTNESLFDYPIAFWHGRRDFQLSEKERHALADYVSRGGFVMADAICASNEFATAFRREMKAAFPDHSLEPIPPSHPLFSQAYQGYDIAQVRLRDPRGANTGAGGPAGEGDRTARIETLAPVLEGIQVDGRWVVVFSPYDLSCALENQTSISCKGYVREDAAKIGMNLILYAMQE